MSGTSSEGEQPGTGRGELLRKELDYIEHARSLRDSAPPDGEPPTGTPRPIGPGKDLCGLALSGGGIRSATFNLGLLQGLQQLGLLGMFDYAATVSGGGYIGGFWTAWRHYAGKKTPRPTGLFPMNEQQARVSERGARGAHLSEVRHLREFSNFLSPRLGLLSLDTGRMVVAALSAVVPALLASLSFLILVLLLWDQLARFLITGWVLPVTEREHLLESCGWMLGLTCAGLLGSEWLSARQEKRMRRTRVPQASKSEQRQEPRSWTFAYYLGATLVAAAAVVVLWGLLLRKNHLNAFFYQGVWMRGQDEGDLRMWRRLYVLTPALAWLGAAGLLVLLRWWGSRFVARWVQRPELAAVDRVLSRLLLLASLWSFLALFWLSGRFLRELLLAEPDVYTALKTVLVGTVAGLTALFAKVQQLFGRQTSHPVSANVKGRAKSHLPQLLAYAVLSLILLGLVLLLLGASDEGWLGKLTLAAGAITGLTVLLFEPNFVGLHDFYRDRIARTFIGAAHGEGPGQTEPHPKDDLPLDELKPGPGPLHLICCAANDLSSEDPVANLYRGADSAVLSPLGFSVGKEGTSWEELRTQGTPAPTLAEVITASGAAFNSHMGSLSVRLGAAVTFLMTSFNLRLGLWLPHPTRARMRRLEQLFVGWPFYKELLGRSRAHSRNVLLSDGGHFENLALYELVRRHCRFILVSDCGMDANAAFNDFANAVRRVREDFGVEIRIDLSPLRTGENKAARQSVVAGDIEYPDGDTGVLLLVKPTLLGNEPADIAQYKAHNAAFPHESTGDQFYDEAQWEAYRRLGEHTALTAFRPVRGEARAAEALSAPQVFSRARYEWLPVPAGYPERFSRFVERATALDTLLQGPEARRLFGEIFKEITELDLQAKQQQQGGGKDGQPPQEAQPPPEELANALHMLRHALLLMEEVFVTEDLATYYNHPAFMGLMNYFARWAYAPLLRTWWPLLKTLYSPRFTHFLEERFSLPTMERQDIGRLSAMDQGFAMSCWTEQGGKRPGAGQDLISYQLELPHGPQPRYYIQAAQLLVRTHRADGSPLLYTSRWGERRQVVVWQGDDFYVPPGLWGAGIGDDFLRLVSASPAMSTLVKSLEGATLEKGSLLAVRLQVNRDASAARRKRWADDVQLYRSHGFSEPDLSLRRWLSGLNAELDDAPALRWTRKYAEVWQTYWLTRTFEPKEATRGPEAPDREEPTLHH